MVKHGRTINPHAVVVFNFVKRPCEEGIRIFFAEHYGPVKTVTVGRNFNGYHVIVEFDWSATVDYIMTGRQAMCFFYQQRKVCSILYGWL